MSFQKIEAEVPYESAQPLFVTCQVIALLLGIYNFVWTIRHLQRVRPLNVFNVTLCIATGFLLTHIVGLMLFTINQYDKGSEGRLKVGAFLLTISWSLASMLYLLVIQIRFYFLYKNFRHAKLISRVLLGFTVLTGLSMSVIAIYSSSIAMKPLFEPINEDGDLDPKYEPERKFLEKFTVLSGAWDVFYFTCDIVIGILTLLYILRSASFTGAIVESYTRSTYAKEQQIKQNLRMNVVLWLVSIAFGVILTILLRFAWGSDEITISSVQSIIGSLGLITNALQFTFALYWMEDIRLLFQTVRNASSSTRSKSSSRLQTSPNLSPPYIKSPMAAWTVDEFVSNRRFLTFIVFLIAAYECVRQLLSTDFTRIDGSYNKIRLATLLFILLHLITGMTFTMMYFTENFGNMTSNVVLFVACLSTLIYQELNMHLLSVKMDIVARGKHRNTIRLLSRIFIMSRAIISSAALIIFIYITFNEGTSVVFTSKNAKIRDHALIINCIGNIMYITFIVAAQVLFLSKMESGRSRATSLAPSSNSERYITRQKKRMIIQKSIVRNATRMWIIVLVGVVSIIVMGIGTMPHNEQIPHSLAIAIITYITVMLLSVFQHQDRKLGKATEENAIMSDPSPNDSNIIASGEISDRDNEDAMSIRSRS